MKIAPHIPVVDKSGREDGSLSRGDFTFDKARNVYICPQGKLLHTTGYVDEWDDTALSRKGLGLWPLPAEAQMLSWKTPERKIRRSIHEDARDLARALVGTLAFEQSRRNRKQVERCYLPISSASYDLAGSDARPARRTR